MIYLKHYREGSGDGRESLQTKIQVEYLGKERGKEQEWKRKSLVLQHGSKNGLARLMKILLIKDTY